MQHQCRYDMEIDLDVLETQHAAYISEKTGASKELQEAIMEADEEFWMTRPYWQILAFERAEEAKQEETNE